MPDRRPDPLAKVLLAFPNLDGRVKLLRGPGGKIDVEEDVYHAADSASVQSGPVPMRVRLQPALYHYSTSKYHSWPDVSWTFEAWSIDQVMRFKSALDKFMRDWTDAERRRKV